MLLFHYQKDKAFDCMKQGSLLLLKQSNEDSIDSTAYFHCKVPSNSPSKFSTLFPLYYKINSHRSISFIVILSPPTYNIQYLIHHQMQVFDWQQRQHHTPHYIHIIAGSLAGISQHLSMIPIDNIKTHCQASQNISAFSIVKKIYHSGGMRNFYSGSSIVVAGCAPAHAIYFTIYEKTKQWLNCHPDRDFWKFAIVGAFSSMFHDLIMTPTQALKQRIQLMRSENPKISVKVVAKEIYRKEGLVAFYRSFPVNYAMNIPFGSLIIAFNEKIKYLFGVKEGEGGLNYYLCGALAGAIASIPTTPLDVIKTKLNTQDCHLQKCQKKVICNVLINKIERMNQNKEEINFKSKRGKIWMNNKQKMSTMKNHIKYKNVWQAAVIIMKQNGPLGFFKGLHMRMMIQSISSGVSWGTYHLIKNYLSEEIYHH